MDILQYPIAVPIDGIYPDMPAEHILLTYNKEWDWYEISAPTNIVTEDIINDYEKKIQTLNKEIEKLNKKVLPKKK